MIQCAAPPREHVRGKTECRLEGHALPAARGPITERLFEMFQHAPGESRFRLPDLRVDLTSDDLQLALYCCYELHYQGLPGVDDGWEWEPSLLALSNHLAGLFEAQIRAELPRGKTDVDEVAGALWDMTRSAGGPSLSRWVTDHGTMFHARELAVHRSGYQLKEADPHTWAIPRLHGRAKAAMVAIQNDEYGKGAVAEMHSSLFADTVASLDLDSSYGFYVDLLPAVTLATTNLISMFGLQRRLRGALVGHLAGFEMNSVVPMRRYSAWLESLGVEEGGRRFYDVHVDADRIHQYIAVDDLVGGFLESEPSQAGEVLFGARALGLVEASFTEHVLSAWSRGKSSLRHAGTDELGPIALSPRRSKCQSAR